MLISGFLIYWLNGNNNVSLHCYNPLIPSIFRVPIVSLGVVLGLEIKLGGRIH